MIKPTRAEVDEALFVVKRALQTTAVTWRAPSYDRDGQLDPGGARRRLVHFCEYLRDLREECDT